MGTMILSMANPNRYRSEEAWIFKSSIGGVHQLTSMLNTKKFRSFDISVNYQLDIGSDHRIKLASLEFIRS